MTHRGKFISHLLFNKRIKITKIKFKMLQYKNEKNKLIKSKFFEKYINFCKYGKRSTQMYRIRNTKEI